MIGDRPPHDPLRTQIDDRGQIQELPLRSVWQVSYIANVGCAYLGSDEVPLDQVSEDLGAGILDRGDVGFAQVHTHEVVLPHQSGDSLVVDRPVDLGILSQLDGHPPVPIRAIPLLVDVSDPRGQSIISCLAIGSILPRISPFVIA